jgi:uncharacterized protein
MNRWQSLFTNKKKELEQEIEAYLSCLLYVSRDFNAGLKHYLRGEMEAFQQCQQNTSTVERKADQCLKSIKHKLYANMLYPDLQKDITVIFNNLDDVIDISNQVLLQMSIESPDIPSKLHTYFIEFAYHSGKAMDELAAAMKYLFKNKVMIEDHANKVNFYQAEADKIREKIEFRIYQAGDISELSHKRHISHFTTKIFTVSEQARTVAKKLVVFAVKSEMTGAG